MRLTHSASYTQINTPIVSTGAILPTIKDNQNWGNIASKRNEIKATKKERASFTIEYNKRLKIMAEENSLYDIDLNKEAFSIDGIYDDSFLSYNLADHRHLSSDKTAFFAF